MGDVYQVMCVCVQVLSLPQTRLRTGDWWVLPQPPLGELRERKRKRPSPRTVCAAAGAPQLGWALAAAADDGGAVLVAVAVVVVGGRVPREGVDGERGGEGDGGAG